jgi:hypothetical protein
VDVRRVRERRGQETDEKASEVGVVVRDDQY